MGEAFSIILDCPPLLNSTKASNQKENKLYFKYFPVKKKIFRNNKQNLNKDNPFNILKGFNIK